MEFFPKDVKSVIAKNLHSKDILSLFESIKDSPSSSSYNSLWISKIKEEFNVVYIGKEAFEEYKFLKRLLKTKIYNVVYVDRYLEEDYDHDSWVESFPDRESAISFLIQEKVFEEIWERGKKYDVDKDKELYILISKEVLKVFETESHISYNNGYLYINQNRLNKSYSHHF
jgi:hypothetical protein